MDLEAFVRQSNLIEGITRDPTEEEIKITEWFVACETVEVNDLQRLVTVYEPTARLREELGMDVRVGSHRPPQGGPHIHDRLAYILGEIIHGSISPWRAHVQYETLHPFTDGNGRSGRALWLWCMADIGLSARYPLSFLQCWYYQTLHEVEG